MDCFDVHAVTAHLPDSELRRIRPGTLKISIASEENFNDWIEFWNADCSIGTSGSADGDGWVFRGQRNPSWVIESSFERFAKDWQCEGVERKCVLERAMIDRFKEVVSCRPCLKRNIVNGGDTLDDVAWLGIMQHYGVPTRLIDFTCSPLIALYMAAREVLLGHADCGDISVWAIYRRRYPNVFCSRVPLFGFKSHCKDELCSCDDFAEAGRRMEDSKENEERGYLSNRKCANCMLKGNDVDCNEKNINFPKILWMDTSEDGMVNARLRAQKGLFALPMQYEKPSAAQFFWGPFQSYDCAGLDAFKCMEFESRKMNAEIEAKSHLIQFKFCGSLITTIYDRLRAEGITGSALFPDGEGVAEEVKMNIASIRLSQ